MSVIMQASPYENVATKGSRAMAHRSRLIALVSPTLPAVDISLKAIYRDGIQIFPAGHTTTETEFRRQFEARADVLDTVLRIYENALNTEIGVGGGLDYKGLWNANTNSPALASGVGTKGDYYVVGVPGTTNLDGINDWHLGDWAVFNGTVWQKIDNSESTSLWQAPVIDRFALPAKTPGVDPPGEVHYSIRDAQYLVWNGFQWQPSVPNDATWGLQFYDDFISNIVTGREGWSSNSNNGGSIIVGNFAEERKPGVQSLRTGATAAASRACRFISPAAIVFGAQPFLIEGMFMLEALNGVDGINYNFRFGFGENTGNGDHLRGIWFEYGVGTGGVNWFACTNDGVGPPTKVDTLVPAHTGWVKLQIWQNYIAGTAVFLIADDAANLVPVASIATTMPSAGDFVGPVLRVEKRPPFNVGSRNVYHDYVWGGILLNPAR